MSDYTFVSYAHENTRVAVKIARTLQQQGITVWLDQWNDPQQEEWNRKLANALRGSGQVLVILSPAAVNSWIVRDQTRLALRLGKQVVPLLVQACNLPEMLAGVPVIDFSRRGRHRYQAMEQLIAQLGGTPEARSLAGWGGLQFEIWVSKMRRQPQFWPALLGIFLLVAGLFYLYQSRSRAEEVFVPVRVKPVTLAGPIFVPSTEIQTGINPEPTPIGTEIRPIDGQEMVLVPGGDFLMGSVETDVEAKADEKPQRLVYVDAFWVDKTEITNARYRQCADAGECKIARGTMKLFRDDALPVVGVDWGQAAIYCRWVGARLPTEAEWEKAARGSAGRIYPWGDEFDGTRLNFCDSQCVADWRDFDANDGYRYTAPAGSYPSGASPYGVLDMSGNVWEWTADWYAADTYKNAPYKNPSGPEDGLQRVIRGGSWYYPRQSIRVARRHRDVPTSRYDNIGFRCVISATDF